MFPFLKSLLSVHRKPDATAAEIEAALTGARAEIEAAERAGADADTAYHDGLLRLEENELEKLIADRQTATVRRDRAVALVSALAERLIEAQAAEDQAARLASYEEARNAQAAAAKVLAKDYPKLARSLAELLRTIAEADALADKANQALPDGFEPLTSVEGQVRREPNVARRIISDEPFDVWCYANGGHVRADDPGTLKPNPDGRTGTWKSFGDGPAVPVTLRRFQRVTTVPEAPGRDIASLASTLNLPPLGARHTPFWRADAAGSPAGIMAWLDENEPTWSKPFGSATPFDPTPQTEIIPLDEPADRAA